MYLREGGCSWRLGADLVCQLIIYDNRVTALFEVKVRALGRINLISSSFHPGCWPGGSQAVQNLKTSRDRKRKDSELSRSQKPNPGRRASRTAIYPEDGPDLSPTGTDAGSRATSLPLKQEMEALLTKPRHLSWSGDINLTVCHFPFGSGPVEAALKTPSIKCS